MTAELVEARRLDEAARDHMRAARRHRRRAKELRAQLEQLVIAAAERGIRININAPSPGRPSATEDSEASSRT